MATPSIAPAIAQGNQKIKNVASSIWNLVSPAAVRENLSSQVSSSKAPKVNTQQKYQEAQSSAGKVAAPEIPWNAQIQAMHKMAQAGTLNPQSQLVKNQMAGQPTGTTNPNSILAVNKTAASTTPKPSIAAPAPKSSIPTPTQQYMSASAPSGFQSQLDPNDPAAIGGMMMQQNRVSDAQLQALANQNPELADSTMDSLGYSGSPSSRNSQLDALRKSYLDTFNPSPEETAASKSLGDVASKAAADEAAARSAYAQRVGAINEQATLQPFLTGRQTMASNELANQLAAIQSASSAQSVPLSQQLAQLQADREARSQRASAELGFATPKTVTVGSSLVDPETGRIVYQGAEKDKTPISLAPGNVLVDPVTGKTIASAPAKSESEKGININGKLVNPLTGEVIGDYGSPEANKPLSGEAAKIYSIATTIKPEIEQLKQILAKADRATLIAIQSGFDPATSRLIDQVSDKVGRLRSGGAINQDEAARFRAQIIRPADIMTGNTASAIAALDALAGEADSVASSVRPNVSSVASSTGGTGEFDW